MKELTTEKLEVYHKLRLQEISLFAVDDAGNKIPTDLVELKKVQKQINDMQTEYAELKTIADLK